jgi:hypothetical protein
MRHVAGSGSLFAPACLGSWHPFPPHHARSVPNGSPAESEQLPGSFRPIRSMSGKGTGRTSAGNAADPPSLGPETCQSGSPRRPEPTEWRVSALIDITTLRRCSFHPKCGRLCQRPSTNTIGPYREHIPMEAASFAHLRNCETESIWSS